MRPLFSTSLQRMWSRSASLSQSWITIGMCFSLLTEDQPRLAICRLNSAFEVTNCHNSFNINWKREKLVIQNSFFPCYNISFILLLQKKSCLSWEQRTLGAVNGCRSSVGYITESTLVKPFQRNNKNHNQWSFSTGLMYWYNDSYQSSIIN